MDFKSEADFSQLESCLELVKDIVAMANSGGGVIVVGVDDSGNSSNFDISGFVKTDLATITDQIFKYTSRHFDAFSIEQTTRGSSQIAVLIVDETSVPMVFTKTGSYPFQGKTKSAFSQGSIYYRHGSKSEPCVPDDIEISIRKEVEARRKEWLDGIRRIVEAPKGSRVEIVPGSSLISKDSESRPIRLTDDPKAKAVPALNPNTTHPYRATQAAREIARRLGDKVHVSRVTVTDMKWYLGLQNDIKYCWNPKFIGASTQYSEAFVDKVVSEYNKDGQVFEEVRRDFRGN